MEQHAQGSPAPSSAEKENIRLTHPEPVPNERKRKEIDESDDNGSNGESSECEPLNKKKKDNPLDIVNRENEMDSDVQAALVNAIIVAISATSKVVPPSDLLPPHPSTTSIPSFNHAPHPTHSDGNSWPGFATAQNNAHWSKMPGSTNGLTTGGPYTQWQPSPSSTGPHPIVQAPSFADAHSPPPVAPTNGQTNSEHADILATKWLNTRKLAEMVESEGLVYKKGKFSAIEEKKLNDAIEAYKNSKNLSTAQIQEIIFQKNVKTKDNEFWSSITRALPQRPIIAVYHHVRRKWHPMNSQGVWEKRQDTLLIAAVAQFGQAWEKVSPCVGRMASDCRDRYRNHIVNSDIRATGPWSEEEEEELTRIVLDMMAKQGSEDDSDVFWSDVSQLMGGRRNRQQCRIKWMDSLSKVVKSDGGRPYWSPQDAYILVQRVEALGVNDDTEIDWKILRDHQWNLWSPHNLQRRWLAMKRSIQGHEEMSHRDIVNILKTKKTYTSTEPSTSSAGVDPSTQSAVFANFN